MREIPPGYDYFMMSCGAIVLSFIFVFGFLSTPLIVVYGTIFLASFSALVLLSPYRFLKVLSRVRLMKKLLTDNPSASSVIVPAWLPNFADTLLTPFFSDNYRNSIIGDIEERISKLTKGNFASARAIKLYCLQIGSAVCCGAWLKLSKRIIRKIRLQ